MCILHACHFFPMCSHHCSDETTFPHSPLLVGCGGCHHPAGCHPSSCTDRQSRRSTQECPPWGDRHQRQVVFRNYIRSHLNYSIYLFRIGSCVFGCVCVSTWMCVHYQSPVMQSYPDIRGDSQDLAVHQVVHKHILLPARREIARQCLRN